jgi:hypothetical protein
MLWIKMTRITSDDDGLGGLDEVVDPVPTRIPEPLLRKPGQGGK